MRSIVLIPRARRHAGVWRLSKELDLVEAIARAEAPRWAVRMQTWAFGGLAVRLDVAVDDEAGPLLEADGPQFEYLTMEERESARAALRAGDRFNVPATTSHWRRTARNCGALPKLDEVMVIRLHDICIEVSANEEAAFVEFELWVEAAEAPSPRILR